MCSEATRLRLPRGMCKIQFDRRLHSIPLIGDNMRAFILAFTFLAPASLAAQGWIVPRCPVPRGDWPPGQPQPMIRPCNPMPAQIIRARSDVRAELTDRVVRYTVDERFVNRGAVVGE